MFKPTLLALSFQGCPRTEIGQLDRGVGVEERLVHSVILLAERRIEKGYVDTQYSPLEPETIQDAARSRKNLKIMSGVSLSPEPPKS